MKVIKLEFTKSETDQFARTLFYGNDRINSLFGSE